MARRNRTQARRSGGGGGIPGWVWLAAGVLLGLALSVFVLWRQGFDAGSLLPRPNPAATAPRSSEEPVAQGRDRAEPRKPRYDFYTLLPEKEAVIPQAQIDAEAASNKATPPPPGERFVLQAGAFRDAGDADGLKAQLALLGLEPRVQAVVIEGVTWHRVRLGPYQDLQKLDQARRQLAQNNIEAIAVKAPRE